MSSQTKTKSVSHLLSIAAIAVALVVFANYAAGATTPEPSKEISDLNKSIEQKKKELADIKNKQDEYRRQIEKTQAQKANLQNQLSIVDARLGEAQLKLDQVKIDIETTNLEIQKTNLEIAETDNLIKDNKDNLGSAIKLLSQENNRSQLEIILLNNYLTEYISQVKYLENINGKISGSLSELKDAKDALDQSKSKLDASKEKLRVLRQSLEQEQVGLADEKDSKIYILDQTKSSEAEYQRLLNQAKREQQSAASDIVNLDKALRERINQQNGSNKITLKYDGFIWPVTKNTITAEFHDPTYPFRNVFEHPAVDIRAKQGTPIKAAASGYVGRARDAGMGYSYIMLVHADGLATVYGHVSKIYVREDEYVSQGQVIALSGAMPGTPGAGPLTTGPHLHFEVRLNGIPVNPREYLP